MQKDVHFYLTFALARKVGIVADDALKIAWADQYTDDLTEADLHGIQTQSAIIGNWRDRQIQRSVLVPFHFVPGDDKDNRWKVTANSSMAQQLIGQAKGLLRFGIALHTLQDTFSHQGFTGWDEKINACYPWYYLQSGLPNIGHAEMQTMPDIVSAIWTDPRSGEVIDNKKRAIACAKATFDWLLKRGYELNDWPEIKKQLQNIFRISNYDQRKTELIKLSSEQIRYGDIKDKFQAEYRGQFIKAASQHCAAAIELMKNLS